MRVHGWAYGDGLEGRGLERRKQKGPRTSVCSVNRDGCSGTYKIETGSKGRCVSPTGP